MASVKANNGFGNLNFNDAISLFVNKMIRSFVLKYSFFSVFDVFL